MDKSKIYTRSGDYCDTSLVGGTRISKGDSRIDLYGEVDTLNSFIGAINSFLDVKDTFLYKIQNLLFNLGSNLACEQEKRDKYNIPKVTLKDVEVLELKIDELDKSLTELRNFILPGGSKAASMAHLARTSCRELERKIAIIKVSNPSFIEDSWTKYINRLSDFLFVYARYINKNNNVKEINWDKS